LRKEPHAEIDGAWRTLADERSERALMRVIDEAMDSDPHVTADAVHMGDPRSDTFVPWAWSPTTDAGTAAAAATILKREGWTPSRLFGDARYRFVEPGLADGPSWLGAERFLPDE
jgi:hypothetical protein